MIILITIMVIMIKKISDVVIKLIKNTKINKRFAYRGAYS